MERAWSGDGDDAEEEDETASVSSEEEPHEESKDHSKDGGVDSEEEKIGDNMTALIKAAAIWLTEQDQATDSTRSSSKTTRGRALPSKRSAPLASPRGKSRGGSSLTSGKRRRVHF